MKERFRERYTEKDRGRKTEKERHREKETQRKRYTEKQRQRVRESQRKKDKSKKTQGKRYIEKKRQRERKIYPRKRDIEKGFLQENGALRQLTPPTLISSHCLTAFCFNSLSLSFYLSPPSVYFVYSHLFLSLVNVISPYSISVCCDDNI